MNKTKLTMLGAAAALACWIILVGILEVRTGLAQLPLAISAILFTAAVILSEDPDQVDRRKR